jgi:hypothetical protein
MWEYQVLAAEQTAHTVQDGVQRGEAWVYCQNILSKPVVLWQCNASNEGNSVLATVFTGHESLLLFSVGLPCTSCVLHQFRPV